MISCVFLVLVIIVFHPLSLEGDIVADMSYYKSILCIEFISEYLSLCVAQRFALLNCESLKISTCPLKFSFV